MARVTTKGICAFCKESFSKATISRHLAACPKKAEETRGLSDDDKIAVYHLVVEGRDAPMYWMHLRVPAELTLENLDFFLRDTWLECCGHLSCFELGSATYASSPDEYSGDVSMDIEIGDLLKTGQKLSYEYDFGSTTELALRVLSQADELVPDTEIKILARNEAPSITCQSCKKEAAESVCTECMYSDEAAWLCERCAEDHPCGDDFMLPVVNSPRVGVCAYEG